MIIDGRALAQEVLARTRERAQRLPHPPKVVAYVAQNPSAATRSYMNIKKRSAEAARCLFEETTTPISFSSADAVLIQLPLDEGATVTLDVIPLLKDADVLSSAARDAFARGDEGALLPPVVGAIAEMFTRYNVQPLGKKAIVIGAGFLVGEPAATWLTHKGAHVTVCTLGDDLSPLKDADIIISGAGSPHLIKPSLLKEGVVLIDAGTSELAGMLAGDADPACAAVCALFTPVPGGVGPLAVAKLFENVIILAESAINA
ncbi:MAG TPA: bifunctional 5,10-methylenetetrahydrofolate dehydrogenase/5,10-methenyltetrahydrofolate cyclohydrolase [Candidatus Paceibacterota bacterium]|nr:bifunctional 5,10-methylenetetrahydrofolate dehydrogenase/5,10-methenyltetrahydrofolate cyclohydrolase [Candidatus Paceibacterota bacterium]